MTESICPNCGALRSNTFCAVCGQNSRDYNESIWVVLRDAVAELFELDGKVIRSMRTIVMSPGQLSVEFAANRRANFVNPFRLFIFTSIAWFFLFSISFSPPEQRPLRDGVLRERMVQPDGEELRILEVREGLQAIREVLKGHRTGGMNAILRLPPDARQKRTLLSMAQFYQSDHGMPFWVEELVANLMIDALGSPGDLVDEALDNLPLMMFVLLPWYTLVLGLIYLNKHYRLIHNLVFAIHVHAFAFLLLSVSLLTPGDGRGQAESSAWDTFWGTVDFGLVLLLFIHTYFAFKRFYGDGVVKTGLKYLIVGFFYSWGLVPAFLLVVALTLSEYL